MFVAIGGSLWKNEQTIFFDPEGVELIVKPLQG